MDDAELSAALPGMHRLGKTLVALLLEGADPRLGVLRAQWAVATSRVSSASEWGFYMDIDVPADVARVDGIDRGAGHALIPVEGAEHPAGSMLYVEHGALSYLEVNIVECWEATPVFGTPTLLDPFSFTAPLPAPSGTSTQ